MPDRHLINVYDLVGTFKGRIRPIAHARYTRIDADVGDFEVVFPWVESEIANLPVPGYCLEFEYLGEVQFGGLIRKRSFKKTAGVTEITLSGPSYMAYLVDRIAIPPPATEFDAYTNIRADNLLKAMVRKHMGSGAAVARQVINLVVAADTSSSSFLVNYNGRYETLLEAFKSIIKQATDVRYQIVRNSSSQLEFRTYVPYIGTDKSVGNAITVQFDMGGGNVSEVEYTEDGTGVRNYVYGGGPGDGAARMIREGVDNASVLQWGRIEDFVEAASAKTTTELDVEILKRLTEVSTTLVSMSFKINVAGRYEYGRDFKFGDRVSAIWKDGNDGLDITLSDVISGLTVNLDEHGLLSIDLSIGQPNLFRLSPGRAMASYIRGIRSAVATLQHH